MAKIVGVSSRVVDSDLADDQSIRVTNGNCLRRRVEDLIAVDSVSCHPDAGGYCTNSELVECAGCLDSFELSVGCHRRESFPFHLLHERVRFRFATVSAFPIPVVGTVALYECVEPECTVQKATCCG